MRNSYHCPSCFMTLSERQKNCPNCGKENPYYREGAESEQEPVTLLHAPEATVGKCEFCDSEVYSDEQFCTHCGAPNPKYVVHPDAAKTRAKNGNTNASTGKCPYCGGTIRSNEPVCKKCGSPNPHYIEDTVRVIIHPKTIDELKEYCAERDMPLLRMRFFIGEDYQGPQAFGIYKDTGSGRYVVYKNKSDGSRAVRYSGPDEAYAVNQIFQKLMDECRKRGINPDRSLNAAYQNVSNGPAQTSRYSNSRSTSSKSTSGAKKLFSIVLTIIILAIVIQAVFAGMLKCAGAPFYSGGSSNSGGSYYSGGSSYDYDSGSSWDWGSDDSGWDWDSDDSSWDSGDSWDSWDSGDSSWDSDW